MLDLYKTHAVLGPSGVMELLRKILTPIWSKEVEDGEGK